MRAEATTPASEKSLNGALAAELERLGVPFVAVSPAERLQTSPTPTALVAGLAASVEARLRLALIPLFLARPDYALVVDRVAGTLTGSARVTLICYYTAAVLLQKKYSARLERAGRLQSSLPVLFDKELTLSKDGDLDLCLSRLAELQAELTGIPLNWVGTYEYAAKRLLQRVELEVAWANS